VVVADQQQVDAGQGFQRLARGADPLRAGEGQRAGTGRPDRVQQQAAAADLQQEAGMADEGDSDAVGRHPRGRRLRRILDPGGPGDAAGLAPPGPDIGQGLLGAVVDIVEDPAIEMVRARRRHLQSITRRS
jgi:hypothetical protein